MTRYEYIQVAISPFLTKMPSIEMIEEYYQFKEWDFAFQDFVCDHTLQGFQWSTAIGIIEAAEHIVNEAYANGNIK